MYLEIFLADFAVFRVFWGISWDFAEIPEFHGSATARNIRSPEEGKLSAKIEDIHSPLAKILTDYSGIESANESHV